MRVGGPPEYSRERFASTLKRIQVELGLKDREFRDILRLTSREFQGLLTLRRDLPVTSLYSLCERLNLSLDALERGLIDYKALSRHFGGQRTYLPERYQVAAFSKRRTILTYLDYLEVHYGWELRLNTLRYFQITNELLAEPDQSINILFFVDLLKYLRRFGFNTGDFYRIGLFSSNALSKTIIGQTIAKFKYPKDAMRCWFEDLVTYQALNWQGEMKWIDDDGCVLEIMAKKEINNALGVRRLGSEDVCSFQKGSIASLFVHQKLPPARIKETACIHQGDSACRYEVDYQYAHSIACQRRHLHLVT